MTRHQKEKLYQFTYSEYVDELKHNFRRELSFGVVMLVFFFTGLYCFFTKAYSSKFLIIATMFACIVISILFIISAIVSKHKIYDARDYINYNGGELCKITTLRTGCKVDIGYTRRYMTNEEMKSILG